MFIVLQDEHRNKPEITLYIPGFRRLHFGSHRKYASGEDGGVVLGCVGEMLHIWLTLVDNIIETIPKLSSAAGAACWSFCAHAWMACGLLSSPLDRWPNTTQRSGMFWTKFLIAEDLQLSGPHYTLYDGDRWTPIIVYNYKYHCVSYPKNIWKVCIGKLPLLFNMLHPIPRSSASNGGWVTTRLTRQRGTMHMEIPRPSKRLTKASWLGGNPRLPKWSRHNIMLISPGKNDTREQNNWGALRLSTCIFEGSCATACVILGSLGLKTT